MHHDAQTRAAWARAFAETARAWWTDERTEKLAAGRRLLLPPAECAPLLRALGLLHRDASMPADRLRKYWQVCHAVRILEPMVRHAAGGDRRVRVLDAGCGRSYLSLVLAHCAIAWDLRLEVLGIDRQQALITAVERRTELAGLDDRFRAIACPLDGLDVRRAWQEAFGEPLERIDGVLALHACDTATCDAIVLGVGLQARWLALAPCCQAELARGWTELGRAEHSGPFAPIHRAPHLCRQTASHVTDTLRTLLLRACGYEVTPMEFVPAEHTPKNTLLRATWTGIPDRSALEQHSALVQATGGVSLQLAGRLLQYSS
jgi:SAM-dependent methyltransferase